MELPVLFALASSAHRAPSGCNPRAAVEGSSVGSLARWVLEEADLPGTRDTYRGNRTQFSRTEGRFFKPPETGAGT